MGIGGAPGLDQGGQFFFRDSHVQGTHSLQCPNGHPVATGQFCDFPLLAELPVDSMLYYRKPQTSDWPLSSRCPSRLQKLQISTFHQQATK